MRCHFLEDGVAPSKDWVDPLSNGPPAKNAASCHGQIKEEPREEEDEGLGATDSGYCRTGRCSWDAHHVEKCIKGIILLRCGQEICTVDSLHQSWDFCCNPVYRSTIGFKDKRLMLCPRLNPICASMAPIQIPLASSEVVVDPRLSRAPDLQPSHFPPQKQQDANLPTDPLILQKVKFY